MSHTRVIERLRNYEAELQGIASRFTHSNDSLYIGSGDDSRLHQMVIELRDLFADSLGTNNYGALIIGAYQDGLANFLNTPSLNSVRRIKDIVAAAATRIEENPTMVKEQGKVSSAQSVEQPQPLALPEKVTLKWLWTHVPFSAWLLLVTLLASSFFFGVTAALKLPLLQQWYGVLCSAIATG